MRSIPLFKPHTPPGAAAAIDRVLQSGQIAGDGDIPEFEAPLREFLQNPHLVLTAEFSRSLEMVMRMAGLGHGDTILVSAIACLASTMPILQTGARPVWCDIDPETGNMDPNEILQKRRADTKAVLLYHWVGNPADLSRVLHIAGKSGLTVIEDAGEALGSELNGRRIGSCGSDYTVFSFNPVRHITTGEGAAITFKDADQQELAKRWRRYGIPATGFRDLSGELNPACDIVVPGSHNFMSRMAGALGTLQMDHLQAIVSTCRKNGKHYDEELRRIPGIRLLKQTPGAIPSYWVYSFLCDRRDDLLVKLRHQGIYASKVHMRNDLYSCFETGPAELPGVARFEREQISIPAGWWVTEEDQQYIVNTIRSGW